MKLKTRSVKWSRQTSYGAHQVLFGKWALEPFQMSNFFRVWYNSCGKIFEFIMDSDSTDDIVTKQMVQKHCL